MMSPLWKVGKTLGLGIGLMTQAWAWQIQITAPEENAEVEPGSDLLISVSVTGAVAGISQVQITLEGDGFVYDYPASPPTNNDTIDETFEVPNGSPGQTLTISARADGYADERITASRTIRIKAGADTTPPSFTGVAASSERLIGNTDARIEWPQAHDNVTADAELVYEVYLAEQQAAVFTGTPTATLTGTLFKTLDGLEAMKTYYVGVRVIDKAGNRDANTTVVELEPLPNAAGDAWTMYE